MNDPIKTSKLSSLAVIVFGFVFTSVLHTGGNFTWSFAVGLVFVHFSMMVGGMLLIAESNPVGRQDQISIRGLSGLTLTIIAYCSLLRLSLRFVPWENVKLSGWASGLIIAGLVGWALVISLSDCTAGIIWWLARWRRRQN